LCKIHRKCPISQARYLSTSRLDAKTLAGLLRRIQDSTISGKIAKEVFEAMWTEGKDADAIIEAVMATNPAQLADYRAGKEKLFGFFVGQVMKATQGKANPAQLNELLRQKLKG
jgi:aspartyl-tRNA(Asn)/glutamyl-tRNA(Gln) amidotransferase subunit B